MAMKYSSTSTGHPFSYSEIPTGKTEIKQEIFLEMEKELEVLREWGHIQTALLMCLPGTANDEPWRKRIEKTVAHSTHGAATIMWKKRAKLRVVEDGQFINITWQNVHYGWLKLQPGYLVSHALPDLPQTFAAFCGLLLAISEHHHLLQRLLEPLQPLDMYKALTPREYDVLKSIASGESEGEAAERLSIAITTLRTHRHNLYRSLEVHNPEEAVLRSFSLRLIDWLDPSFSTEKELKA